MPPPVRLPSLRVQQLALVLLAFLVFGDTLWNRYAYDDAPVLTANEYVQAGVRGIVPIFTSDAYASFYASFGVSKQLAGGRYRPLSIATFAIEHELFGENAAVRHGVNVVLFALTLVVLLSFLREVVLPGEPALALLATLLFAVHPIHTEVVANIKSRDELMSLLFLLAAFLFAFRHFRGAGARFRVLALLAYLAALLSKEWGVTFVALLPIAFLLLGKAGVREAVVRTLPFAGVAAAFLALRFRFVAGFSGAEQDEILNNPFRLASAGQALATKLFVLLKYLALLVWPARLSYDYSWQAIPYRDLGDPLAWLGALTMLGLVVLAVRWVKTGPALAFAAFFYLAHLALVSNLIFPIGAMLGERLVYHSSVGFCILAASALVWAIRRLASRTALHAAARALVALVLLAGAARSARRNLDWKDDDTLSLHDVEIVPAAVIANGNACQACLRLAGEPGGSRSAGLLARAVDYCQTALANHPTYVNGWINLGLARVLRGELDDAAAAWGEAKRLFPSHPGNGARDERLARAYLDRAQAWFGAGQTGRALRDLDLSRCSARNGAESVFRTGGLYFVRGDLETTRAYWLEALRLDPTVAEIWFNLGNLHLARHDLPAARDAVRWALALDPGHARAERLLRELEATR